MNIFEDKYLRERIVQIIARQKEGQIVIASYKDGTGLPTREDLGAELTRAAFPYDYTVGKFGFLKYNAELSAYVFTPKPGEKLPQVLANYRPLTLAEAVLDLSKRVISIQVNQTQITFTGVQPWKGLYEVITEINTELARQNTGVVVWKITPKGNEKPDLSERLFSEGVPQLRNGQAMAHVTGYAYDSDHALAYIGLVSYKTSLESLRVTLMCGKPLQLLQEKGLNLSLFPTEKYESAWQPMPEYTSHHVGFISRLSLPGKWEPEDQNSYLLVFCGTPDPHQELLRLFIERLTDALEYPLLDEWAAPIWKAALDQRMIQDLTTGGDCILGAKINLQSDWLALLTGLLQNEDISLAN
ncbi:MAG: hypothetical protein WCK35_15150 [Chloroflexota bacterium]